MGKKVSYVIVTWNNEKIIRECIETLIYYSGNYDAEVIVVDNNSQDNTCSLIRRLFENVVKLIELPENIGFSKANNIGLKSVTGEYTFFVNPDIVFIENIIDKMVYTLETNVNFGVVVPRLLYKDRSFQISVANFPGAGNVIWNDMHLSKFLPASKKEQLAQARSESTNNRCVDWAYGAAMLCRTDEVKKIGGFPEESFMYGEDTELCMIFLKQLGKKTYYLYDVSLVHFGGYSEQKVVNSKKIELGTNASLNFVKKYFGNSALLRYGIVLLFSSGIKYCAFFLKAIFSRSQIDRDKGNNAKGIFKATLKYYKQF